MKNRVLAKLLKTNVVERHVEDRIKAAFPAACRMGEFRDNDVFLVGYPKSGNTWLQNLLAGLTYGVCSDTLPGRLVQEMVPDVHYKKYFQRFGETTCFKSHHLPRKEYRRVIYIVRDGRDALVSYWHYHKALTGKELDFENMVESPIEGHGKWADHVLAWMDNPYDARLLLLKYEDLLQDGASQLRRICEFLELDKPQAELEKIVEVNQFDSLKEKEKRLGFGHDTWKTDQPFFRRGVTGAYKDEMPLEAIRKFNEINRELMKKLSYE